MPRGLPSWTQTSRHWRIPRPALIIYNFILSSSSCRREGLHVIKDEFSVSYTSVWFYIWIIKFKPERLMKLMVTKLLDFENHWFSYLPAKINWSHLHTQIAFCFSFENVYLPSFSTKVSKSICKKCNSVSIMLICMETKALFLFQLILLWLFLSFEYNALVT